MIYGENVIVARVVGAQIEFGGAEALQVIAQEHQAAASAFVGAASLEVEPEVFVLASDTTYTKALTVNDVTGKVNAYRLEKFTARVNWPKTLSELAPTIVSLASCSKTFLGFLAFASCLYTVIKNLGVELTTTEVLVFAAIYDHRDDRRKLEESDLVKLCVDLAVEDGNDVPSDDEVSKGLDQLSSLGIVSLQDGLITLEDDWVIHGRWR